MDTITQLHAIKKHYDLSWSQVGLLSGTSDATIYQWLKGQKVCKFRKLLVQYLYNDIINNTGLMVRFVATIKVGKWKLGDDYGHLDNIHIIQGRLSAHKKGLALFLGTHAEGINRWRKVQSDAVKIYLQFIVDDFYETNGKNVADSMERHKKFMDRSYISPANIPKFTAKPATPSDGFDHDMICKVTGTITADLPAEKRQHWIDVIYNNNYKSKAPNLVVDDLVRLRVADILTDISRKKPKGWNPNSQGICALYSLIHAHIVVAQEIEDAINKITGGE